MYLSTRYGRVIIASLRALLAFVGVALLWLFRFKRMVVLLLRLGHDARRLTLLCLLHTAALLFLRHSLYSSFTVSARNGFLRNSLCAHLNRALYALRQGSRAHNEAQSCGRQRMNFSRGITVRKNSREMAQQRGRTARKRALRVKCGGALFQG